MKTIFRVGAYAWAFCAAGTFWYSMYLESSAGMAIAFLCGVVSVVYAELAA